MRSQTINTNDGIKCEFIFLLYKISENGKIVPIIIISILSEVGMLREAGSFVDTILVLMRITIIWFAEICLEFSSLIIMQ